MEYSTLFLLGRIIYGGYFLMNGIRHFMGLNQMAQYAQFKGIKSPKLAVAGSGVLLVIGGLGILLGVFVELAILARLLFLLPVSLKMHAFWKEKDPQARMMEMIQFQKNLALAGAAFMMLAIPQPWPLSI